MPYNKLLTNFTCSGLYWGILALGRFCTDLAALGPYCHDLGPIFPSTVSKRLIFYNSTKKIFSISSFFLKYLNFDSCLQLWIMSQIPNSATFTYLVKYITGYLLRVMLLLVTLQKPNRGLKPPPHPHTPPPQSTTVGVQVCLYIQGFISILLFFFVWDCLIFYFSLL